MKYFLDSSFGRVRLIALAIFFAALGWSISALGELPSWIRNIDASSAIEAVFFRMMSLPNGAVAFRRPPSETRPALAGLIKAQPRNAELYSLRALEDEQQLDFPAAESDWKAYVENSSDKISAQLALADFYHHRLRPADEIKTLSLVANAPPRAAEKLTPPAQQRSWQAFERIFGIIQAQGLPKDVSIAQYRAWIARYPEESSLYAQFLQFLVAVKEYPAAGQLIADYRKQFPNDQIFPVKAKAMVEYRRGSVREGLSVYEQSFQPLWDPQLVKSYFDLLRDTQNLRKFRDDAHAALVANPEDLNATARLFYYYQQQGKTDVAQQAIADLRLHKEAAKSPWTSQELYVCARLLEDIHAYPESARYYFALYNSNGNSERPAGRAGDRHCGPYQSPADCAGDPDSSWLRRTFHVSRYRHHGSGARLLERNSVADSEYDSAGLAVLGGRAESRAVLPSIARGGVAGVAGCEVSEFLAPGGVARATARVLFQLWRK